jgi:hypothetical protein
VLIVIQSTRPATINFMIADSPVGLLAWIWDKLVDWSDDYPWTEEEVCLFTSIYVFSCAGPDAASYIYYEALHPSNITIDIMQGYIDCPLGIADFPVEICNNPVSWRHTMGKPCAGRRIIPYHGLCHPVSRALQSYSGIQRHKRHSQQAFLASENKAVT